MVAWCSPINIYVGRSDGACLVRDVTKFVKVVYRSNFVVRHWGDFLLMEASRKFQNGSSTLLKTRPRDSEVLEILVS